MTLKEILADIGSVIKQVIASSAVAPAAKADLHDTIDNAVAAAGDLERTVATGAVKLTADAPAEAAALTGAALGAAAGVTGPLGGIVTDVVEPMAEQAAEGETAKFLAAIEAHNKSLMADLYKAAGMTPPAS